VGLFSAGAHDTYGLEKVGFQILSFRQSLPPQESHRPFGTAEKPRKRGLLQTKILTAASARNAVLVSLSPVVSKAPDFAILVRNFKRLILNGYQSRRARTFRIPQTGATGSSRGNLPSGFRALQRRIATRPKLSLNHNLKSGTEVLTGNRGDRSAANKGRPIMGFMRPPEVFPINQAMDADS
jgi:hypothetical protein